MKKLFLFMFFMFLFICKVNAEACDAYDIKRLKEIANGVEITYEQQEPYDNGGTFLYDIYKIRISGLTDEIYIYDHLNKKRIFYSDTTNGEIFYSSNFSGKDKFEIYSSYCSPLLLSKNLVLPVYNVFHNSEECKQINYAISYCDEYLDVSLSGEDFMRSYNGYLENTKQNVQSNNFIYYIISIFIIILIALIFVFKRRNEVLK